MLTVPSPPNITTSSDRSAGLRRALVVLATMLLLVGVASGAASASTAASCPDGDVPEDGFIDVPVDNVHEYNVDCLAWWAITAGTGEDTYSPDASVTRQQMGSFLVRTYEKVTGEAVEVTEDHFVDDDGSIHETDINKLAELGITAGCNPADGNTRYCPTDPVTRAQMGSFLVRTYQEITDKQVDGTDDRFIDDDGNVHEANINRLAELGITAGCNPSDGNTRYCPTDPVTRAQMATFLMRELGVFVQLGEVDPPPASEDGQTNNDGDPCEVSECPEVIITSAVANDNGDGYIGTGDRWVIRFSVPMSTTVEDYMLRYRTTDDRYEYFRSPDCERGAMFDCYWQDDTTLRIEPLQDIRDETYPAEIIRFDVRSADGEAVDLGASEDVLVD